MQSLNFSKIIFVIGMLAISGTGIYTLLFPSWYVSDSDPLTQQIIGSIQQPRITHTPQKSIKVENPIQTTASDLSNEKTITNADIKDNIQWHSDRGYYSFEEQETYKNYDRSVLEAIAQQGDTRALNELSSRLISEGKTAEAIKHLLEAAALGDSACLLNLAILNERPHELNETEEGRKANDRASKLEALAFAKVAAMRGDIAASKQAIKSAQNIYNRRYNEPLEPTKDELDLIDKRATEIYQNLQARRYELGLGDFDNSTSKVAKELYKNL